MQVRFFTAFSFVVVLMLGTSNAFSEPTRTSDVMATWVRSHPPQSWDLETGSTRWQPNFNDLNVEDTLGPWREPSVSTGKRWREPIFSDYRLVLNGKTPESEVAAAPRIEEIAEKKPQLSAEEMGEMVANPLSYLWFGQLQNDVSWWKGDLLDELDEDAKIMNTTLIQPVMAMQLTKTWKNDFPPHHTHSEL